MLAREFLAAVENLSARTAREPGFRQRLGVDDQLLVGGGIQSRGCFVEVLDHVQLHEHAAQLGDDLALLLQRRLLFCRRLVHVLGGLGDGGGFQVVEHLLDLIVGKPAQALRDLFEHLPLGCRREPLEGHRVDGRTGPPGGFIDSRLNLLLLVPLLGGIEVF